MRNAILRMLGLDWQSQLKRKVNRNLIEWRATR